MKKVFSSLLFAILILTCSFAQSGKPVELPEMYENAMEAYHSSNYIEAHKLFEEFITGYDLIDELYASAKYYSADALLNLGKTSGAAAVFEFLVNNYDWSAFKREALYKLGLIYFHEGMYAKSRSRLKLLIEEYPSSPHAGSSFYWIGESFTKENKPEEAISFLEEAVNKKSGNKYVDYSIFTLASTYEKLGDYKNAVKYYDRLLSYHQDSPLAAPAHVRIGICYFKLKDYQSSILELNNPALSSLSSDLYSESIYMLANSYYRVKEYNNAEKSYNEIINKFPESNLLRESKYGLAWTYFQQQNYGESYDIFDDLSQLHDSIGIKSFYWKAEAKSYSGQVDAAFDIYNKFLNSFPNHEFAGKAQYQIGVIYFDDGNLESAAEHLTVSSSSRDNSIKIRSLTLKGEINLSNKNFIEAEGNFRKAIEIPDVSSELKARALLGLGASLYYLENYAAALEYLSRIHSKVPGFEKDKVNFYLAETYYAIGNYSEALKKYNQVDLSSSEAGKSALYGKAYSYFSLNNYSNAASQFSRFVKEYPNDQRTLDARLRLADSYYGSKNFSAASKVYKDIFRLSDAAMSDPYAYYQYAQALYKAGSIEEAINEFENLQKKFPNSKYADKSLYIVGWINFQQSNFEAAISNYREALDIYPNSDLAPIIYYSIGDAYFNQGKYNSAIDSYQKLLDSYPNSNYVFDAVNGIQYSYVALGQPDKAVNLIDNFITQNPGLSFSDKIFFKKGEIYYSQREYERAKISYKEFIANYPNSGLTSDAYYWIGKSAQNLGQKQAAIFNFNRVFNEYMQSESAGAAIIEIGNILRDSNNYDSALVNYNRAISKLKGSRRLPEIFFMKGMTLSDMHNIEEAYAVFAKIVNDYPTSVFADKSKLQIGMIELAANRFQNADNFFVSLSNSRSDELGAKAQYYYGLSLFEQGKLDSAIAAFMRVRTVFSGYDTWLTMAYLKLGETYTKLENFDKAKDVYRAVLAKHKGDQFGQEAQKKLRELQ